MTKGEVLERLEGQLIVSCQALPGEPLYVPEKSIMYLMARAAKAGGAGGIRTNGVLDVIAIKEETGLPVIGIVKVEYEGYESYITPTMKEVDELAACGADIVALDCTDRKRGDGLTPYEFVERVRARHPNLLLMADISTFDEGAKAAAAGVDFVGTTMSGYTAHSPKLEGPDFELIARLSAELAPKVPVIAEGRIHAPDQASRALELGAFAVVVGGAITRPKEITQRFAKAIRKENAN